jgi:hypothetical protein
LKRLIFLSPLVVLALLLPSTAAGNASYVLQIDLYGDYVVPPVDTHSYGFVRFFFNEDRSEADYTLDVKGYSNNSITGVSIHAGAPGENGPEVMRLSDGNFIVTAGHLTLTPEQQEAFASGGWYLVLTTVFHPEGEMRGQIVVPADFFSPAGVGGYYPPPSDAPGEAPVVSVPPPGAGGGAATAGGATSGGGNGGLFQPPNTGDGGLR